MRCFRCGWCCQARLTMFVQSKSLRLLRFESRGGAKCPLLKGDKPGEYSCGDYGGANYREKYCDPFMQRENKSEPCRIGEVVLSGTALPSVEKLSNLFCRLSRRGRSRRKVKVHTKVGG